LRVLEPVTDLTTGDRRQDLVDKKKVLFSSISIRPSRKVLHTAFNIGVNKGSGG